MKGRHYIQLALWGVLVGLTVPLLVEPRRIGVLDRPGLVGDLQCHVRIWETILSLSVVYTIFRICTQHQTGVKFHASTVIPVDSPRAGDVERPEPEFSLESPDRVCDNSRRAEERFKEGGLHLGGVPDGHRHRGDVGGVALAEPQCRAE